MATNQPTGSSGSKAKRNGFLLFVLGCMIAVSGAAKLNEGERVMRIRQSAERATMKKVRGVVHALAVGAGPKKTKKTKQAKRKKAAKSAGKKAMTTRDMVLSIYRAGQDRSQARAQRLAKAQTLLQVSYIKLVHLAVAKLKIRQPRAVGAELKAKLLRALAGKLIPVPPKKRKASGAKVKLERALVTAMATELMKGKKSKSKAKAKSPRPVRDVLALLVDQAARHLTPYMMWEALLRASAKKIEQIAQREARTLRVSFAKEVQAPVAASDAKKKILGFLSALVRRVGKTLKLKSSERSFRPDNALVALLAHRIQPRLTPQKASALVGQMSALFCRQIAASFGRAVAWKVGEKLQFSLTQVASAGGDAKPAPRATKRSAPAKAVAPRAARRAVPAKPRVVAKQPAPAKRPLARATSRPLVRPAPRARVQAARVAPPVARAPARAPASPAARPTARTAPNARPAPRAATRPAARPAPRRPTARAVPRRPRLRVPPQRKVEDPLLVMARQIVAMPPVRPQRVAFLKTRKRIGGWPSSMPVFFLGSFLALIGLLWWRKAIRIEVEAKMADQQDDHTNPFTLLKTLQEPMEALSKELDQLDEEALCARVDELLSTYVLPFAEVRQGVIEQLGMKDGAEILVTVAFGERMLNRVWSAASDGHLPEAHAVYPDALDALREAHTLSQTALKRSA